MAVTKVSKAVEPPDGAALPESFDHPSQPVILPRLAIALLILQPLLFYRRHLFLRTVHIPYDIQMFHLPLSWFIARCARLHTLPLWDPFSYCGVPIHADIQAQLFYPFTWIAILISNLGGGQKLFYWLEWLNPLHMVLGGIFTYLLFRTLLPGNARRSAVVAFAGATVYQLGPSFVSQAQHVGAIASTAWFPLTILSLIELSRRMTPRWFAVLAFSIAMSFLSGFPATTLIVLALSGLFAVALSVVKMANWRLPFVYAAGCAFAFALAAVQMIPTMQLSAWSIASIRYQWKGNGGGLHPQALASFFWPNYYHIFSPFDASRYKLPYDFTGMYTFCGFLALLLILAAPLYFRRSRLLCISAALFLFSAVWMLGENTPLYPPVFRRLPHFLQGAMYAECALLGFSLFAAMIAGLVLSFAASRIPLALLSVIALANSWNLIAMGANRTFNTANDGWKVATASWNDGGYMMPQTLVSAVHAVNPPLRIDLLEHDELDLRSRAEIVELPNAAGDNPFLPLRYYHLRLLFSGDPFWSRLQLLHSLNSPWIPALNVGFVVENGSAPKRNPPPGSGYESMPYEWLRAYRVDHPLPRFYLAKKIRAAHDETGALAIVKEPGFDPAKQTVVERYQGGPVSGAGSVHVLSYANNRVELSAASSGNAFLVSSETLYPGWQATVNGKTTPILPTNVAFRGIALPSGTSRVVMTYSPGILMFSVLVSLASALAAVLLFLGWPGRLRFFRSLKFVPSVK